MNSIKIRTKRNDDSKFTNNTFVWIFVISFQDLNISFKSIILVNPLAQEHF